MNDEEIIEMLSDIVSEIDYDIWKEMFEYYPDRCEEPELEKMNRENLINIVRRHLGEAEG